jgi:hypothetical protein
LAVAGETLATVPPALDTVPLQLVSLAVLLAVQTVVPVPPEELPEDELPDELDVELDTPVV